jgi:hypothetical protein
MLREEVLKGWKDFKEKLSPFLLTSGEKETLKFLERSKLHGFYANSLDLAKNEQLDELEEKIKTEQEVFNSLEVENNDILISY